MKKIIIPILLLIVMLIPKSSNALTYVEDTSHLSHNLPYYTNIFNYYNVSNYNKAMTIISNTLTQYPSYKFVVLKRYSVNSEFIDIYLVNSPYISYTYSTNWTFTLNGIKSMMTVTSSTSSTTYVSSYSSSKLNLFYYKKGYSVSSYTGSKFYESGYDYQILYSNVDIPLNGDNIYNDNILLKMNLYGIPYTFSTSTNTSELYSSITFNSYDKGTTQYLSSGDNFYTSDLSGTMYTFSSSSYKNVIIDIINNSLSTGDTFNIQLKTDNSNSLPAALYGLKDNTYEFISYINFNYDNFFPSSYIYTIGNNQICINGICRTIGDFSTYQIRYDLETISQNSTFIYSGSQQVLLSYDTEGFDYTPPSEDNENNHGGSGTSIDRDDIANDPIWFQRTNDYFSSLGDMDTLEKLNPIYWLKGIGYIFIDLLVPTSDNNSFQEVYDALYEKFPIINDLKSIVEQVFDESLINSSTEAPKITINLEPLGLGLGILTLIDFAFFDDFIKYIRIFIVSFMLLELVFWYYKKIGGII